MEVTNGRGYVYSIQYHIVWCVKYKYKILDAQVENRLIEILEQIADDNGFQILEITTDKDHIHLFINCSPQHYIPNMIKALKGVSARLLIKEFGNDLKERLWDGHLWNSSYFVATVSENTEEQIRKYIQNQKVRGGNEMLSLETELKSNSYPGRGIVIGKSKDGKFAITAYFIMGRSENSRNRIFVEEGAGIRTQAFDPSKLSDPSLIIYAPVRVLGNKTIVTNGDQTDTIYTLMDKQQTFEQALRTREFEPDAPNYTPRISGIMHVENGAYNYAMSILKSNHGNPSSCNRYTFAYENPMNGEGHFIHTYMGDGNPLPSFEGEPKLVEINGDIEEFTNKIWNSLNEENKVSLFVRYIEIATGKYHTKIVNKNKKA